MQGGTKFTREELRDLFQLNEASDCNTRDLLAQLPGGADWQVCLLGLLANMLLMMLHLGHLCLGPMALLMSWRPA